MAKKRVNAEIFVFCDALHGIQSCTDYIQRNLNTGISSCTMELSVQSYSSVPAELLEWSRSIPLEVAIRSQTEDKYMQEIKQGFTDNTVYFVGSLAEVYGGLKLQLPYDYVATGGTFDHLHAGHRVLLSTACALCSKELTIGITTSSMLLSKSHADLIDDFSTRQAKCTQFVRSMFPAISIDIHELVDAYGPAVTKPELQALIVSSETVLGGFRINGIRRERGMTPLDIVVLQRRDAVLLSSSFIRSQLGSA